MEEHSDWSLAIVRGPRYELLVVEAEHANVQLSRAIPKRERRLGWNDERRLIALEYVRGIQETLQSGRTLSGGFEWGREGLLFAWGMDPRGPESVLEDAVLSVEICVNDLVGASTSTRVIEDVIATMGSRLTSLDVSNGWTDASREAIREVLRPVAVRLRDGNYLDKKDLAKWTQVITELGVRYGRSPYEITASTSPPVEFDRKASTLRNWSYANDLEVTQDVVNDGPMWAQVYRANVHVVGLVDGDEVASDSFREAKMDRTKREIFDKLSSSRA